MPRKKIFLLALTTLLAFAACERESTELSDNSPKSTWTFDGVTYKEGTNPTMFASDNLSADNSLNSSINIQFGSRPGNGTYTTTSLSDTPILGGHRNWCSIDLSIGSEHYKSLEGSVQVSVNGGKLTAAFTNVKMEDTNSPHAVDILSGTLIEK